MPENNNTNMDINKNKNATVPVFEFTLPTNELDTEMEIGEVGEVIIPVEVVQIGTNTITFRKLKSARTDKTFRKESLDEMRSRIGIVKNVTDDPDKKESENDSDEE
jgi:hypothetical protein